MKWFNDKNKIDVEQLNFLNPTSKTALKNQCMMLAGGDIDKAERIYDFYTRDVPDLPTVDPVEPTWMDSTKKTLGDIMQWANNNPNTVSGIYAFIQQLSGGRLPSLNLAQVANDVEEDSEALPPIN